MGLMGSLKNFKEPFFASESHLAHYMKSRIACDGGCWLKKLFTVVVAAIGGFFGVTLLHGTKNSALSTSTTLTDSKQGGTTTVKTGSVSPKKSTTAAPLASTPVVNGSAVGKSISYGYGQISVKVTVAKNKIVDVGVSSIKTLDAYSTQLEQQVVPTLRSEVFKANGTHILLITGATYTSEAYAMSLQNALNQLHFK